MSPIPTVETMKKSIAKFNKAVDEKNMLAASVLAALCTAHLCEIVKQLESGEVAIVSKADRESALDHAESAGCERVELARQMQFRREARQLLKLEPRS